MSDSNINISVNVVTAAAEKALGSFEKSAKGAEKQTQAFSQTTTASFKRANGAWNSFVGNLAANAVTGVFNSITRAAGGLFKTLIVDGVRAAQVQEDAINQLNTALEKSGNFSELASKDMQDFASELQRTTKVGDETTLSMLALAATFGKSNEETKNLVKAAVELSAATGITLESAVKNLGKTYSGLTGELGESLPIIRSLTAEQLKAGEAVGLILNRFGGSAAAQVNTFSGAQAQLANQFGDLTEQIGFTITKSDTMISVFQGASNAIAFISKEISTNSQFYKELAVSVGIATGVVAGIGLASVAASVGFSGLAAAASFAWAAITGPVGLVIGGIAALSAAIFIVKQNWDEISIAVNGAIAKTLEYAAIGVEVFSSKQAEAIRAKAQAYRDEAAALEAGIGKRQESIELASQETAIAEQDKVLREEKLKAEQEANNIRLEEEKRFQEAIKELKLEAQIAEQEATLTKEADELIKSDAKFAKLVADVGREKAVRIQAELDIINAEENIQTKRIKNEQLRLKTSIETNKKIIDDKKRAVEDERKRDEERVKNFHSTLGTISTLMRENNSALFAAGKAAAMAQATIDGYAAVVKALASAPPPFNFVLAGLVGAAAVSNIARIASTPKPKYERGGIVPGTSFTGDRVEARVNSGEMILNRSQQSTLFQMANGGSPGGSQTEQLLAGILGAVQGMGNMSINIDGREIISVVRNEIASGRSFA